MVFDLVPPWRSLRVGCRMYFIANSRHSRLPICIYNWLRSGTWASATSTRHRIFSMHPDVLNDGCVPLPAPVRDLVVSHFAMGVLSSFALFCAGRFLNSVVTRIALIWSFGRASIFTDFASPLETLTMTNAAALYIR